jgi:hypothetical protein
VSSFLANNLTWIGVVRGVGLLAVLWWAWVTYSWLTNAIPAEEALLARIVLLAAMAAMLMVALAVPDAFGDDGVLFGLAYFVVRVLHVLLYALATDPETRDAILRLAPGFSLLVASPERRPSSRYTAMAKPGVARTSRTTTTHTKPSMVPQGSSPYRVSTPSTNSRGTSPSSISSTALNRTSRSFVTIDSGRSRVPRLTSH